MSSKGKGTCQGLSHALKAQAGQVKNPMAWEYWSADAVWHNLLYAGEINIYFRDSLTSPGGGHTHIFSLNLATWCSFWLTMPCSFMGMSLGSLWWSTVWGILLQICAQYNRLVESNIEIRNHPLEKSEEVNCDLHLALLNYRSVQKMSGLSATKISFSKNLEKWECLQR